MALTAKQKKLEGDDRMKVCVVPDCTNTNVEWNHAYQGVQRGEPYVLQPVCLKHHRGNFGTITQEGDIYSKYNALLIGKKEIIKKMGKDWFEKELRAVTYRKNIFEETLRAKLNWYI